MEGLGPEPIACEFIIPARRLEEKVPQITPTVWRQTRLPLFLSLNLPGLKGKIDLSDIARTVLNADSH